MELPLNTIAVVTELYQRILIQLIQWKCVWLKSTETHSSAGVLLIHFHLFYPNCVQFCLTLTEDEESAATRDVSRHFEDTSYGYKDFSRHGMHVPTFRVQVKGWGCHQGAQATTCARYQTWKWLCSHCPMGEAEIKPANEQPLHPVDYLPWDLYYTKTLVLHKFISEMLHSAFLLILRIIPGKTMAIPWLIVFIQMWDNYLMRSSILLIIWLTTQWPCTKMWIPQC